MAFHGSLNTQSATSATLLFQMLALFAECEHEHITLLNTLLCCFLFQRPIPGGPVVQRPYKRT